MVGMWPSYRGVVARDVQFLDSRWKRSKHFSFPLLPFAVSFGKLTMFLRAGARVPAVADPRHCDWGLDVEHVKNLWSCTPTPPLRILGMAYSRTHTSHSERRVSVAFHRPRLPEPTLCSRQSTSRLKRQALRSNLGWNTTPQLRLSVVLLISSREMLR